LTRPIVEGLLTVFEFMADRKSTPPKQNSR
jgi:hypothetical protein